MAEKITRRMRDCLAFVRKHGELINQGEGLWMNPDTGCPEWFYSTTAYHLTARNLLRVAHRSDNFEPTVVRIGDGRFEESK